MAVFKDKRIALYENLIGNGEIFGKKIQKVKSRGEKNKCLFPDKYSTNK